jgi:hypothetical protein
VTVPAITIFFVSCYHPSSPKSAGFGGGAPQGRRGSHVHQAFESILHAYGLLD